MDLRQQFQPAALFATHRWTLPLEAEFGHADITSELQTLIRESGIQTGGLTVQMLGSTGAITTIEYESGALRDLRRALEVMAPADADYAHNARWGDGNGSPTSARRCSRPACHCRWLMASWRWEPGSRWWRSTWTTGSGSGNWSRCSSGRLSA